MQSNWWFVPERVAEGPNDLMLPRDNVTNGSKGIKKASAMTIYLHGVFIATSKDPSGTLKNRPGNVNDLFIATNHKTGNTPKVHRIHYFKEKQPINKWYSNFFDSVIYSTIDFKNDIFVLNIQIYDIDSYDKYKETLSAISENGNSIGVTFPSLSPFTAFALPVAKGILNLVDTLDEHDSIIDDSLRLEISEPNIGATLLQTGNFIYFNEPQSEGLKFDSTKKVVDANGDDFTHCDYLVISIRNKEIQEINEWENNQKASKLMAELQGKGSSGKAAVDFVKDTLDGYTNFNKLKRIRELETKQNLTPEEKVTIIQIKRG